MPATLTRHPKVVVDKWAKSFETVAGPDVKCSIHQRRNGIPECIVSPQRDVPLSVSITAIWYHHLVMGSTKEVQGRKMISSAWMYISLQRRTTSWHNIIQMLILQGFCSMQSLIYVTAFEQHSFVRLFVAEWLTFLVRRAEMSRTGSDEISWSALLGSWRTNEAWRDNECYVITNKVSN